VASVGVATEPNTDAVMVDDEPSEGSSTVMQRLNVAGGSSSLRLEQNPQAKLKALLEISRSLGRALSLHDVLPKVLDGLMTIFPHSDRGVIVLRDGQSGKLVPRALKHRRPELVDTVRISRTIVQGVMASKEAILSADAASDKRFAASESIVDFHIRSVMCAPLVNSGGDVSGVIQIDTADPRNRFTRDDLDVLASVACQAAIAVENAELHETALRDQRRSRELEVAHDVMRGFLPKSPPRIEGYEFFDFYEPALELGGDYYDYIPVGDRLAVVVADVSGKGVPASLLVARLSADVRNCLATEPTPADAVAQLNRLFIAAGWEDRFVTLLLAVLDPRKHELTLVDAGHPPAYLCQNGAVIEAVSEADMRLPLGVTNDAEYTQMNYKLEPGDWVGIYTDGFSEATNQQNELYGLERFQRQMGVRADGIAAQGRDILRSVKEFVGDHEQSDDMCLVCLGRVK
jgi:serine phosphatase RsbU (regulator of sigma subunit)